MDLIYVPLRVPEVLAKAVKKQAKKSKKKESTVWRELLSQSSLWQSLNLGEEQINRKIGKPKGDV